MFTKIRVDGFRSLIDFEISLTSGINVLVGNNGTGKTNFINFLDFIGLLCSQNLNSAIALAQGAGSVFSQETFSEDSASMSFSIEGKVDTRCFNAQSEFFREKEEPDDIRYIYSAKISYLKKIPAVFIESEHLNVKSARLGEVEISRFTDLKGRNLTTSFRIDAVPDSGFGDIFAWLRRGEEGESQNIEEYMSQRITPGNSFVPYLFAEALPLRIVASDLSQFQTVNINPDLARSPTPVESNAGLRPNGEGLGGALYQLKAGSYYSRNPRTIYSYNEQQPGAFSSILSWCKEVNGAISTIDVGLDFFAAKFNPSVTFSFQEGERVFPFSRISDGTVKWIALVTILFAEKQFNIVEEPENFLHPYMQQSFIGLCRDLISEDKSRSFVISTHSPVVLDRCNVDELTIFEVYEGKSFASKVKNADELRSVIAKSRFGLGYFFQTGGVYGENRGAR